MKYKKNKCASLFITLLNLIFLYYTLNYIYTVQKKCKLNKETHTFGTYYYYYLWVIYILNGIFLITLIYNFINKKK